MSQVKRNIKHLCYIGILVFFIISVSCLQPITSTKGKVIEIDPNSVEYLADTFDHLLVFFLQQRNEEYESLFEEFVKDINQTFSNDHTLYAVTYLKKDTFGKLAKFNNKSEGFRIITKRNHYEMNFNNQIRQFELLKRFYAHHAHPVIPIMVKQQFTSIETEYFVVFEYASMDTLKDYMKIYGNIYDFLKLFNVRAVALESQRNQSKIYLYKKSNLSQPITSFENDLNNIEELIDFINVETLPLVAHLDDENYVRIFGSSLNTQFLLIYDEKDANSQQVSKARKEIEQVALFNRQEELNYQRILFAESSVQFMSKYFDNAMSELQNEKGEKENLRILLTKTDYDHFQLRRWFFDAETYGSVSKDALLTFIQDVRMKRIEAEYKSEKIPTQAEQSKQILRKIVGKTFIQEIYQKSDSSVVVLFIDSKDPKSYKQIKQNFEEFTKKYESALKGKVICAIFDLALNEHKFLSITSAPKLSLFQRTNKKSPKNFKGYPNLESIKNWLNYQIKDFTIPQNFGEQILPLGGPSTSQPFQKNQPQTNETNNPLPSTVKQQL